MSEEVEVVVEGTNENEENIQDSFKVTVVSLTGGEITLQVSPNESAMEIRQILCESVEGFYITSFTLVAEEGKKNIPVEDYSEMKDQKFELKDGTKIKMQFANYDDKGIRQHISRLIEIIEAPLSDVYLSTGSFQPPETRHPDKSYPSYIGKIKTQKEKEKIDPEAVNPTFGDTQYALDVDSDLVSFINRSDKSEVPNNKSKKKGKTPETKTEVDSSDLLDIDSPTPLQYLRKVLSACNLNNKPVAPYNYLCYSGWNPPPPHRRLMGDLYYLECGLLDGTQLNITASTSGFYVNQTKDSTTLLPERNLQYNFKSETLLGLLNFVDSTFASSFEQIIKIRATLHPFEATVPSLPHRKPWLVDSSEMAEKYTYNRYRSDSSYILSYQPLDPRVPSREWNEEFQSCKDLPSSTPEEALVRDRTLFKIHADFVDSAVRGAMAVVNRQLAPVNPMDPELHYVFMHNNIFFSYAVDGRGIYKDLGGDKAAHVLAKQDIQGLRLINDLNIPEACVIATVIVDYKGRRVVAQAILPGILQGDQEHKHVYGSVDHTKDVRWDEKFHEVFTKIGQQLHLRPHKVRNSDGTIHEMALPADCKGILGADKRLYLLELVRFTPRDPNFKDRKTAVLRPELILTLLRKTKRINDFLKLRAEKLKEEKERKEKEDKEKTTSAEGGEETKKEDAEASSSESPQDEPTEEEVTQYVKEVYYNTDLYTDFDLADDADILEEDTKAVGKACEYLINQVLPQMIKDLAALDLTVIDTVSLTRSFHERGINMRYLGRAAQMCKDDSFVRRMFLQEMVARVLKHDLRKIMEETLSRREEELPSSIAKYLNTVFGSLTQQNYAEQVKTESTAAPEAKPSAGKRKKKGGNKQEAEAETKTKSEDSEETQHKPSSSNKKSSNSFIDQLKDKVKELYEYDFLEKELDLWSQFSKISLLRALCYKTGLRIRSRDYDFTSRQPFSAADVCDFQPIVTHIPPKSQHANAQMEEGIQALQLGRLEFAFQHLNEALALYHQVMGPMNQEVAGCFAHLGNVLFHAGDVEQAFMHHHKALLISRRVLGFDHSLTAHIHQYLGLVCHAMNNNKVALGHFRRSHYLMRLISGFHHPESSVSLTNIGMMLQELGQHQNSIQYLKEALSRSEEMMSSSHPQLLQQIVACGYALSVSLSQMGDFKSAVNYQKKVYETQKSLIGNSEITAESEKWLSTLLKAAVEAQKKTLGAPPKPPASLLFPKKSKRLS